MPVDEEILGLLDNNPDGNYSIKEVAEALGKKSDSVLSGRLNRLALDGKVWRQDVRRITDRRSILLYSALRNDVVTGVHDCAYGNHKISKTDCVDCRKYLVCDVMESSRSKEDIVTINDMRIERLALRIAGNLTPRRGPTPVYRSSV